MAISAEELNIILQVRDKEFQRKMRDAERRVQRFQKNSTANLSKASKGFDLVSTAAKRVLPALAAGVVIGQIKRITAEMDEIGKKADQIGLSTDALQELRFVAEGAGVTQEKFTSSMERFSKRLGEAEMGTGAAKRALEQLNLEASDLTSIPLEDALNVVADRMADIESPTERAALAAALFGREGVAMVNMLREGAAGLDEMRKGARDAGAVIDEDLIRNAEEAQTRLDAAARVIKAQLSVALADLVPIIVAGAEGFAAFVKNIVGAIEAVDEFLNPQSDLEIATDNLVRAMGDEILQSQKLEMALGKSTNMSIRAAEQKLKEAKSRHENAKAAIAEQKALALDSQAYSDLLSQIDDAQAATESLGFPAIDAATVMNAEAFEQAQQRLVDLRLEQQRMLSADEELTEQFQRTQENINALEEALENASNGMVSFGENIIDPIEASDRLANNTSRVSRSTEDLINNLGDAGAALELLGMSVEQTNSIFGKTESSMESAFMSIVDGTKTASEAFRDMARSIIAELTRVLVVQQMVGSFDASTGTGSGIVGAIMGAFSGRASGGSVMAGQAYRVGEHGPEPFIPAQNGRILSVAQAKSALGGGQAGPTVNQTINVTTGVQQTVRAEIKSLMPQITEAAVAATRADKMRRVS